MKILNWLLETFYWLTWNYVTSIGIVLCGGGKGSSPPPVDPNIGLAAQASAEVGNRAVDLANQQFEWNKAQYSDMAPLVKSVINSQINAQNTATDRANQEWNKYQNLYAPVEQQFVNKATSYATPEKQAEEAARAGATTANAFDQQQGVAARNLERRGVSPGALAGFETGAGLQKAAAVSNAENEARRNTELQGLSNLETVTNIGLNRPATSVAQNQLALSGGNAAVGNTGALQNMGNAGYNAALAGYGTGLQAYGQQGSLGSAITNANMSAYQADQQANAGLFGALGAAGGLALNAGLQPKGFITNLIGSSKDYKTDKKPIDGKAVLAGLEKIPVEKWRYKPGLADSGKHIGPYAEDVRREFGDTVAPGGKAIDVPSLLGLELAGLKSLSQRVSRLERSPGLHNVKSRRGK